MKNRERLRGWVKDVSYRESSQLNQEGDPEQDGTPQYRPGRCIQMSARPTLAVPYSDKSWSRGDNYFSLNLPLILLLKRGSEPDIQINVDQVHSDVK